MTTHPVYSVARALRAIALACLWTGSIAGCGPKSSAPEVLEIPAERVLELSRSEVSALVLDVRTPKEYASGHVPGAVNIPHTQVQERLGEIEPYREREVVVYCERGGRAAIAADVLSKAGFRHLEHMQGDMSGWRKRGLPLER